MPHELRILQPCVTQVNQRIWGQEQERIKKDLSLVSSTVEHQHHRDSTGGSSGGSTTGGLSAALKLPIVMLVCPLCSPSSSFAHQNLVATEAPLQGANCPCSRRAADSAAGAGGGAAAQARRPR